MQNFIDWFRQQPLFNAKPWIILGKGPSFGLRQQTPLDTYHSVGLNHVPREQNVDLAHIIDIEVLAQCGQDIERNSRFLVMPMIPHENMHARADMKLADWLDRFPVLKKFDEEGRLLWYDLSTASTAASRHPKIQAYAFSSEAVLGLLAQCGVRKIRSLGLDGGTTYAKEFEDLRSTTCLSNGQQCFDEQFKHFPAIINRFSLDYASLADEAPMKVFIGASSTEWLPAKVLEYSIRKNASFAVQTVNLANCVRPFKMPLDASNKPRTPFSFQRFLIPELMQYSGRAIYLDSDMLVLQDIAKLWRMPFSGANLICTSALNQAQRAVQYSVMLLDCNSLNWNIDTLVNDLDSGALSYEALVHGMAAARKPAARIPPTWNFLDKYVPGTTALIHYTNMHSQPWLSRENDAAAVWFQHLREAVLSGGLTYDEVEREVRSGNVRPSLLSQLEMCIDNPSQLSNNCLALDNDYIPRQLAHAGSAPH
ncbi:MAG: hypothetical protein K2W95_17505 [Candidatus Obscuribacterales bacterium]|nr:hypothetical protein [Candidatus Obscuribacterales bacterium]